jgi:hypothetical protein
LLLLLLQRRQREQLAAQVKPDEDPHANTAETQVRSILLCFLFCVLIILRFAQVSLLMIDRDTAGGFDFEVFLVFSYVLASQLLR